MAHTNQKQVNIEGVIQKIKQPNFTFSQLDTEYFAPINGAAYAVAVKMVKNKEKRRLKITQLRKLFAEIKRLERELKGKKDDEPLQGQFYDQLWLLQPELAYAKGRNLIDADFFELMRKSLVKEKLRTVADFRRFSQFLTAVVAYSKYISE